MKIPVLFPKIFDYPFTYKSEISESLNSGDFVKAPFGLNEITGVVWPYEQKTEKQFKIKKISKKINVKNLNSSMIEFISWFSKYNLVPLGMSLKMCLLNKDVVEKTFVNEFNKFKVKNINNPNLKFFSRKKEALSFFFTFHPFIFFKYLCISEISNGIAPPSQGTHFFSESCVISL